MIDGTAELISGSVGSGKSLVACGRILTHLSRGGTVVTNLPLYIDKIAAWMREECGVIFDPDRLRVLGRDHHLRHFHDLGVRGSGNLPVLMVLDEAAMDLNARNWKQRDAESFEFVVMIRHLGINLVFIAQDSEDMDKQIRRKFTTETHCRSMTRLWEVEDGEWVGLPIFFRVTYTLTVGKKPWRRGWRVSWKGPGWGFYDTHALHGERAGLFGALEVAKDSALEKVQYDPRPYYWAAAAAALSSSLSCLLVN